VLETYLPDDLRHKEDIVIFNGRLCDEKQPYLFDQLKEDLLQMGSVRVNPQTKFIKTQDLDLSKTEYYDLLAKSKVVVSFALQENFGFGIAEAAYLGCTPVLPNRLVYPELYHGRHLYDTFDECKDLVANALNSTCNQSIKLNNDCMNVWFGDIKDDTNSISNGRLGIHWDRLVQTSS
jgi:hypothetical protein